VSELLRTSVNVIALGVLTVVLIVYAGAVWARDVVFDDRYPLVVAMETTGGLVAGHDVTLLGKHAGRIEHIDLTEDGVAMRLLIEPDVAVPEHVLAQVIRRSAIGEHTLNLIPVKPDWEPDQNPVTPRFVERHTGWDPAEPGSELDVRAAVTPVEIPVLLGRAEELLRTIDKEDLATAVFEVGTAVRGRGEVLVDLNRQSAELNETLVAAIPDFDRLIDASGPVLASLSDHRSAIADMITNLADVSDILADNRPALETLLDDGTRALEQTDALVRGSRQNLTCMIHDFRDVNRAQVENLHWIEQLLDMNRYFFDAVGFSLQWDPLRPGLNWFRVGNLVFAESTGSAYDEPRPTPETRPGAACVGPFGLGVNAVRQPDHQPPHPTSPGIDWQPLVAAPDDEDAEDDAAVHATAVAHPREPTPVTGGGHGLLALGLIVTAYGLYMWRRRMQ
jgi:ABC-type transporter Mla subunit MlaD